MTYETGPDNRLLSDGTWNYSYDDEGNLTKKINITTGLTWTYGYDHRNQLIEAERRTTDGGALEIHAEYKYDVYGLRNEKVVDSDGDGSADLAQRYALDGWDIYADLDYASSLTTRYVRGEVVDQLFARLESDGSAFWDYTDHLGSIRDITDNSGVVVDALTYDAFGNILSETDPQYRGRYAWTGREFDVETGLQYNRARYYDSTIGRWLSQDPLGFGAGDSNLYRYVLNLPTVGNDPLGRFLFIANNPRAFQVIATFNKRIGDDAQEMAQKGIILPQPLPPQFGAYGSGGFLVVPIWQFGKSVGPLKKYEFDSGKPQWNHYFRALEYGMSPNIHAELRLGNAPGEIALGILDSGPKSALGIWANAINQEMVQPFAHGVVDPVAATIHDPIGAVTNTVTGIGMLVTEPGTVFNALAKEYRENPAKLGGNLLLAFMSGKALQPAMRPVGAVAKKVAAPVARVAVAGVAAVGTGLGAGLSWLGRAATTALSWARQAAATGATMLAQAAAAGWSWVGRATTELAKFLGRTAESVFERVRRICPPRPNAFRIEIDPNKFKYIFGEVTSGPHNTPRSLQNARQMNRIGIQNMAEGQQYLTQHLQGVAQDLTNVARTFQKTLPDGRTITLEVRESLLAGPGGFVKLESTWEVLADGTRRLTTVILFGGG